MNADQILIIMKNKQNVHAHHIWGNFQETILHSVFTRFL